MLDEFGTEIEHADSRLDATMKKMAKVLHLSDGKGSLHLKKVTFFTLGSDPPLYFPESVTKIPPPQNKAFKVQYYAILDHVFEEKKSVTKTDPDPPPM